MNVWREMDCQSLFPSPLFLLHKDLSAAVEYETQKQFSIILPFNETWKSHLSHKSCWLYSVVTKQLTNKIILSYCLIISVIRSILLLLHTFDNCEPISLLIINVSLVDFGGECHNSIEAFACNCGIACYC